jgi:hypothetical protein
MRNDEPRPVWMSLLITIERRAIVCVKEKKCNTLLFWKNSEAFFSQPSVKPVQEDLNPKRLTENYSPICPSKFRLKISGRKFKKEKFQSTFSQTCTRRPKP